MPETPLLDSLLRIGLAALVGFLIGLERSVRERPGGEPERDEVRDFVLYALLGAVSAFASQAFDSIWILVVAFLVFGVGLFSGYWAEYLRRTDGKRGMGVTSEGAAILTFLLGALIMGGQAAIAIPIGVLMLVVLSQREVLRGLRDRINQLEVNATVKLLVITFIVLPLLPRQPLDGYFTFRMGTVTAVDTQTSTLEVELVPGQRIEAGDVVELYGDAARRLGTLEVLGASEFRLSGRYEGDNLDRLGAGSEVRTQIKSRLLITMLSAITPYQAWMIVILVSAIGFVGYLLVRLVGPRAGIGLTGLVGGLASSTVTTLSFARRSRETPALNGQFAIAVILASSMMFPRLLVQISVVNLALMRRMMVPVLVMGAVGFLVAGGLLLLSRREGADDQRLQLENPFSLGSAIRFGLVFVTVLVLTRLGITYLGQGWLPLVAFVSGLTDADAIAFSVSNAQRAGIISLDWASFNAVLGAIANTVMKLLLVLALGDRKLFVRLIGPVALMSAAGLVAMLLYYDLGAGQAAG